MAKREVPLNTEKCVWDSMDDDLIRSISNFLPAIPLTPKGVLYLTLVDKRTRVALKEWVGQFRTDVERTTKFCEKIGMTHKDVNDAVTLSKQDKGLDDDDVWVLAFNAKKGALGSLLNLNLDFNQISDTGLIALSDTISKGAMVKLTCLGIAFNKISDAGIIALAEALKSPMGALGSLVQLWLQGNRIGDEGMKAIASAADSGALPLLLSLELRSNVIGDAGMVALANAIKPIPGNPTRALPSLLILGVDDGLLGTEHPQLKAACEARGIVL